MQATLTASHIGTYVTIQRDNRSQAISAGTYQGVRPSEWDGVPYHMFVGGHINGTDQGDETHGFPAGDAHHLVCDADPRLWNSTDRCTAPATRELDETPVCDEHYTYLMNNS